MKDWKVWAFEVFQRKKHFMRWRFGPQHIGLIVRCCKCDACAVCDGIYICIKNIFFIFILFYFLQLLKITSQDEHTNSTEDCCLLGSLCASK